MIKAHTMEALDRALDKGRKKLDKVNPHVLIVSFGQYLVARSNGKAYYYVYAGRTEDRQFFIACECRGGLEGRACYHAAKVFAYHKAFARLRQAPAHHFSQRTRGM